MSIATAEDRIVFESALSYAQDHNTLFLATIAKHQERPKSYYTDKASEYEELSEKLELINTHLEANILRQIQMKYISVVFGTYALSCVHGWNPDSTGGEVSTIRVEGTTTEGLKEMLGINEVE